MPSFSTFFFLSAEWRNNYNTCTNYHLVATLHYSYDQCQNPKRPLHVCTPSPDQLGPTMFYILLQNKWRGQWTQTSTSNTGLFLHLRTCSSHYFIMPPYFQSILVQIDKQIYRFFWRMKQVHIDIKLNKLYFVWNDIQNAISNTPSLKCWCPARDLY